jgi:hypothetical protein
MRTRSIETREMLGKGDLFPHVVVRRLDGREFSYSDVWQRRSLLLISLSAGTSSPDESEYLARLSASREAFDEYGAEVIATRDPVPGVPSPSMLVADRWGEIVAVEHADRASELPPVEELVDWVRFVAQACPECEGETR